METVDRLEQEEDGFKRPSAKSAYPRTDTARRGTALTKRWKDSDSKPPPPLTSTRVPHSNASSMTTTTTTSTLNAAGANVSRPSLKQALLASAQESTLPSPPLPPRQARLLPKTQAQVSQDDATSHRKVSWTGELEMNSRKVELHAKQYGMDVEEFLAKRAKYVTWLKHSTFFLDVYDERDLNFLTQHLARFKSVSFKY